MNYILELLPEVLLGVLSGILFCIALVFLTFVIIEIDEGIEIDNCIKRLFSKKMRYRNRENIERKRMYYEWLSDYVSTRILETAAHQRIREYIDSGRWIWASREAFYEELNSLSNRYRGVNTGNRVASMSEGYGTYFTEEGTVVINSYNGYVYGSSTTDVTSRNYNNHINAEVTTSNGDQYSIGRITDMYNQWYKEKYGEWSSGEVGVNLKKCAEKQFNHLITIKWKRKN